MVSTTGAVNVLATPPPSVMVDVLESDTDLFMFKERSNVTLSEPVAVDIMEPGDFFPPGTPDDESVAANLPSGDVPAGTKVDSYYLHFDNESYDFNWRRYWSCEGQIGVTGSITFDQPIVGVILRTKKLNDSNGQLGAPGVQYDTAFYSGVNITDGCKSDRMILSADRRTLTAWNFTDIHHDNYRVLVAAQ